MKNSHSVIRIHGLDDNQRKMLSDICKRANVNKRDYNILSEKELEYWRFKMAVFARKSKNLKRFINRKGPMTEAQVLAVMRVYLLWSKKQKKIEKETQEMEKELSNG